MQIILHCGAHHTSEYRLTKCLLRNADMFKERGVAVPGPGRYRDLLVSSCKALDGDVLPSPDAREILLDAILDDENCDRMIMSHAGLFSSTNLAAQGGRFYQHAGKRMAQLQSLFNHDQIELFMAIRNPATFLPMVLSKAPAQKVSKILEQTEPYSLRWSDTISEIRTMAPGVQVTLWCYEDAPLIWAQIIREMAGLEHGQKITGGFDLLSVIMSKEGMKRFRTYLHQKPDLPEMQKRRVIAAFLDKYALDGALEQELDLPGWTEDLVDTVTELYDEDVYELQRMPGVNVIAP
jgi:hypothetical protein